MLAMRTYRDRARSRARCHAGAHRGADNGARRLRQGCARLRHGTGARGGWRRLLRRRRGHGRRHRPQHGGAGRLGALLPARRRRSDSGSWRSWRRRRASGCTWTPVWAASCSPLRVSWATQCPTSTSGCPASPRCRPTRTSTATRPRARRSCSIAGRRCAGYQYYAVADWPGGLYFSPTFAGSRPGALSAACWAALVSLGEAGYREAAASILATAQYIRRAIEPHPT
jgi:hypothetical protein